LLTITDAFISKALAEGEFSGLAMRDRSRLKIYTELEVTVQCNAGNERSIDILITINDNIFLAIENKTSRGSIQEAQLQEEVEGLNKAFRVGQDNKDNKLYFLFLTPSGAGPTINKAMNRIERDLCSAEPAHILWKKDERESDKASLSIAELLNGILLDEAGGSTSLTSVGFLKKCGKTWSCGKLVSVINTYLPEVPPCLATQNYTNGSTPLSCDFPRSASHRHWGWRYGVSAWSLPARVV
jgi:hypothetical protein